MEEVMEYKADKKNPETPTSLMVVLGRNGDILNQIPLLYQEYLKTGCKQSMMVAKEYAGILEGCSYIDPVIYDGEFTDIPGAIEYAKKLTSNFVIPQVTGYKPFIVSQVYKNQVRISQENYQKEMWALSGKLSEWKWQHPLIFDKRNPEREAKLLKSLKEQLPKPRTILVSTSGISSPFPHSKLLYELLRLKFGRSYNILSLDEVKAERIYDLLTLFDSSDFLVATDSALLHLGISSPNLAIVALVADSPSMWHGSQYRQNHISHIRYSQFPKYCLSMLDAMLKVGKVGSQFNPKLVDDPRLIHVWSHFDMAGGTLRRHKLARQTWEREYETNLWIEGEVPEGVFYRNTKTVFKDEKSCVYLKDVIKFGALKARKGDIIVYTNSDSCLKPNITQEILTLVNKTGAVHSHRRDFDKLENILTLQEIEKGRHYPGSDLFAFTREWWFEHMNEMPDMVLGYEGWDRILRSIIIKYGGSEIKNGVYHEYHHPHWVQPGVRENHPVNRHCRKVGGEWLKKNNLPLQEFAQFKD